MSAGRAADLTTRWRIILAIVQKDLADALRDSRILGALLAPLLIGLLYSFMLQDEPLRPRATVAVISAGATRLPAEIRTTAGDAVRLTFRESADVPTLRRLVAAGKADIGLALPSGFDRQVKEGGSPTVQVFLPPSPSTGGSYIAAVLERSVQSLTGRPPLFRTATVTVRGAPNSLFVMERLGMRRFMVLWALVFLTIMIAVYALPAILAEELQTGTLDALLMIASYGDVVAAKALFGLVYTGVGAPLLLAITRADVVAPASFAGALALAALVLVGLGLLLGSLLSNPNQLSTWGSLVSLPLIGGAMAIGLGLPSAVEAVLFVLPTSHMTRLLANAMAGAPVYSAAWASWSILVGWLVVAYVLVWLRLRRLEL